jgi:single-strand DNA-binding protein
MTIIGRITKDAIVNTLKDERKVVNFSVAVNDSYKPKGGERTEVTTYYNCRYWMSEKLAERLKKGTLVEVAGRVFANAYAGTDGTAKASLNCHVNNVKIHAWPKVETTENLTEAPASTNQSDDLPF